MSQDKDRRSIAEVTMDGDGYYDELISVDRLSDGTFLVYEKQELFGLWKGFARVTRLDPSDKNYFRGAVMSYQSHHSDKYIIRKLNDFLMKD